MDGRRAVRELLPESFFRRDALAVAVDLIGKRIRRDDVLLRITEVEAYRWPNDSANHCRSGRTVRNAPMWGPPGRAYVYICYGMHPMLNLVTGEEGEGAAVLIRACEPLAGLDTIALRRGGRTGPSSLSGPGRVGAALGLDVSWSHHPVCESGGLELLGGPPAEALLAGPRVGIDYARPRDRRAPWRIADADSTWVSERALLRPMRAPRGVVRLTAAARRPR